VKKNLKKKKRNAGNDDDQVGVPVEAAEDVSSKRKAKAPDPRSSEITEEPAKKIKRST